MSITNYANVGYLIGTWDSGVSYTEIFQPTKEDQFSNVYPSGFLKEASQLSIGNSNFGLDTDGTEIAYQWRPTSGSEVLGGDVTFTVPVSSLGLSGAARIGLVINSASNGNRRIQLRNGAGTILDTTNLPLNQFSTDYEYWALIRGNTLAIFGYDDTGYVFQLSGNSELNPQSYNDSVFAIEIADGVVNYAKAVAGDIATDFTFNYNDNKRISNEELVDPNNGITDLVLHLDASDTYFGIIGFLYRGKGTYTIGNRYKLAYYQNGNLDLNNPIGLDGEEINVICVAEWPTGEYIFMLIADILV